MLFSSAFAHLSEAQRVKREESKWSRQRSKPNYHTKQNDRARVARGVCNASAMNESKTERKFSSRADLEQQEGDEEKGVQRKMYKPPLFITANQG